MSHVIALCGPDGAGKSTLADQLATVGFEVQYGGKKDNHHLSVTVIAYRIYDFIDTISASSYFSHLFLLGIFYPIEYAENIIRVRRANDTASQGTPVCFDRFVVDRMWQRYSQNDCSFAQMVYKRVISIYSHLYLNYFPPIDGYVFLAPSSDVLLDRAPNHYESRNHAKRVRSAYLMVAAELELRDENVLIIDANEEPEKLRQQILDWRDEITNHDESK